MLDVLRIDEDYDEKDFAESEPVLQETEQKSDIENDEQEIKDMDTELSSLPQNKDLLGSTTTDEPIVPQQSQVFRRDGTIWNKEPQYNKTPGKKKYYQYKSRH